MISIYPGFRKLDTQSNEVFLATGADLIAKPETVKELLKLYKASLSSSEISNINSALTNYVVPALGGPSIRKGRASEKQINAAIEFLASVPVAEVQNAPERLEEHFNTKNINKKERRKPRCYLKKLVDYAIAEKFIEQSEDKPTIFYRFKEEQKSRAYVGEAKLMEGRPSWADRNRLGVFDEDFVVAAPARKTLIPFLRCRSFVRLPQLLAAIYWVDIAGSSQKALISFLRCPSFARLPQLLAAIYWVEIAGIMPQIYLANEKLEYELIAFGNFLLDNLHMRMPTVIRDIETILR